MDVSSGSGFWHVAALNVDNNGRPAEWDHMPSESELVATNGIIIMRQITDRRIVIGPSERGSVQSWYISFLRSCSK